MIEHINYEGEVTKGNVLYKFFRSRNRFLHIPWNTIAYVRREKPDFVIVQGTVFPLQVIVLSLFLSKRSRVIVQHHGNLPFTGIKKVFQQFADIYTDAYIFTALGNMQLWLDKKIIKSNKKCFEVLEGSSLMQKQNKQECRARLQIDDGHVYLWVGRLDAEKDPITVLLGFEKYLHYYPSAKLYMIYQVANLLPDITIILDNNPLLKNAVHLIGKIEHAQLEQWYSAADFYLSGSLREGSGYALIESLACGCIPVVTDIPPFRKITGKYGFLFKPGSSDDLCEALKLSSSQSIESVSMEIVGYFKNELSFKKIADNIVAVCKTLSDK